MNHRSSKSSRPQGVAKCGLPGRFGPGSTRPDGVSAFGARRDVARYLLLIIVIGFAVVGISRESHADSRWGIFIGNNLGLSTEQPLRWAETDATRMHDVMRELADLQPENAILLLGETAASVRDALIRLNERIRESNAGPAMLFVHYSGHADERHLHLGETLLALSEIESLVRGSAASFRILVLDACRSGSLTRVKGGKVGPPVPVAPTALASRSTADGVVFLTASSRDEDAQESDAIRGSFFTHYLASGLRGAADFDDNGAVDLEEAYRFAAEHTLRATSTTAIGPQHPTFRHELRGRTTAVLTRVATSDRMGILQLPRHVTWFVFGTSANGPLLAEVQQHDERRTVAIRGQRLFLRGRGRDALLEATVDLRPGQTLDVATLPMARSEYARLVRKGDGGAGSSHGIDFGYALAGPTETDGFLQHGLFLAWFNEFPEFTLSTRLSAIWGGFETVGLPPTGTNVGQVNGASMEATTSVVELGVGLRRAFDLDWMTFEVGGAIGVAWLRQTFEWFGAAPPRDSVAGRFDVTAGAVVDLSRRLYLRAEAGVVMSVFQRLSGGETRLVATFGPRMWAGLGLRF